MERLRIYATVSNVFTLTKYSGFDPEVSSNTLFARGVDMSSYPNTRNYTVGLNINF